jgi:hypothetical protein
MFKDERRDKVWNEIRQHDLRAFGKQLTPEVFAEAATASGIQIGCSALNVVNLVWLGIAKAQHHACTFACVLTITLKLLKDRETFSGTPLGKEHNNARKRAKRNAKQKGKRGRKSKHNPHRNDPTEVTEEAFVQARQRMPLEFWMALLMILTRRFQEDHSQYSHFQGFRLLAMDGTTFTLPKSDALLEYYGRPKNSARKKANPQARMVMMTLPGTRIPIAYEVSPLSVSELSSAARLMRHVRPNDLLLMDRGFISYGLFWQIQNSGAYFGTRLKKGIRYKKVKQLSPKDWLVEWTPKDSRGQWKQLPRSIQLRVIHYQFPGFRASAIITNVLDPKRLSREDWVRVAFNCEDNGKLKLTPGLYHRRWEIETSFFELKVVLKTDSLRSRTPASVEYELAGRVMYYLLIRWLIVLAAEKHGVDPLRISFSNAVRELEQMSPVFVTSELGWISKTLLPRLLARIASHLVPLRPGRHYPRPKDYQITKCHARKIPLPKLKTQCNSNARNRKRKLKRVA